jgi:hypothetical protein
VSVVRVNEKWPNRSGEFNFSFLPSDSAVRQFQVMTDNANDDAITILTSGMVPTPGQLHPNSQILSCRKLDCKQKEQSKFWWDVTAHYSDEPLKPPQDPNPLNRLAVLRFKSVRFDRYIIQDRDQNPIANSANDLYDPGRIDGSRWSIETEKNYSATAIPNWVLTAVDCINSDPFTISQLGLTVDTGLAKVSEIDVSEIKTEWVLGSQIDYRTVKVGIDFRQDGWQIILLDAGKRAIHKNTSDQVGNNAAVPIGSRYYIKVKDMTGAMVRASEPVPLDGTGLVLPEASIPDGLVYNKFDVYQQFDFSQISFS